MLERLHRTPSCGSEDAGDVRRRREPVRRTRGPPLPRRLLLPAFVHRSDPRAASIGSGTYDSMLTQEPRLTQGLHQRRLLRRVGVLRHGLGGRDLVVERGVRGDAASLRQRQATGRSGVHVHLGRGHDPLLMGDPGPIPLQVTIAAAVLPVRIPRRGPAQAVPARATRIRSLTFRVVAKAAGQNPILVDVTAPNGDEIGEPQAMRGALDRGQPHRVARHARRSRRLGAAVFAEVVPADEGLELTPADAPTRWTRARPPSGTRP
mgnify:CR=1 FL=1